MTLFWRFWERTAQLTKNMYTNDLHKVCYKFLSNMFFTLMFLHFNTWREAIVNSLSLHSGLCPTQPVSSHSSLHDPDRVHIIFLWPPFIRRLLLSLFPLDSYYLTSFKVLSSVQVQYPEKPVDMVTCFLP